MRNVTAIELKWALAVVTLICAFQTVWIVGHYPFEPTLTKIIAQYPVDDKAVVYTVESGGGGATVPFTYRYYVAPSIDDEARALQLLKAGYPFLVTSGGQAVIEVEGKVIHARVRGEVHSFRSTALLKLEEGDRLLSIRLDAQPE